MPPAFLLDLQDLDAAGKVFKAPLSVTWLRSALEGTDLAPREEGSVEARYSRSGTDVIVHGRVRALLQIPCARCLDPVHVDVDTDLSLLLVPAESPRAAFARGKNADAKGRKADAHARKDDEYELQSGDAELDVYDGEQVALDGFVREAILLEAPSFPLCSDGCRGIAPPPPEESQVPAIDPRLAPLLKFKKQGN